MIRKASLICALIALLASLFFCLIRQKYHSSVAEKTDLVLACNGNINFTFNLPDADLELRGDLTIMTLGPTRLAVFYRGSFFENGKHFTLHNLSIITYRYYADNQAIEISIDSDALAANRFPGDTSLRSLILQKQPYLLLISRINPQQWLLSTLSTPLMICTERIRGR